MYIIARVLNKHRDLDFFHDWDSQFTASFSSRNIASKFSHKETAENAAKTLREKLPKFMDGRPIEYLIMDEFSNIRNRG